MSTQINPYEAPNTDDAPPLNDDRANATTASLVAWIIAFPTHALAFRAALFFGQFPHGLKSQWDLYPILGDSEFGYLFAAVIYGGIIAELYRFSIAKAIQRFPEKGHAISLALGISLFTTFMVSVAAIQSIA